MRAGAGHISNPGPILDGTELLLGLCMLRTTCTNTHINSHQRIEHVILLCLCACSVSLYDNEVQKLLRSKSFRRELIFEIHSCH